MLLVVLTMFLIVLPLHETRLKVCLTPVCICRPLSIGSTHFSDDVPRDLIVPKTKEITTTKPGERDVVSEM